jgi:hypothetical protein
MDAETEMTHRDVTAASLARSNSNDLPQPPAIESPNENDIKFAPLVWEHVNPYGRYELDMNARLAL